MEFLVLENLSTVLSQVLLLKYIFIQFVERVIRMNDKKLIIHQKKFKGETAVISARLPNDMIKSLDEIAAKTGRNRNEIIQMCLEFAVGNLEIEENEK